MLSIYLFSSMLLFHYLQPMLSRQWLLQASVQCKYSSMISSILSIALMCVSPVVFQSILLMMLMSLLSLHSIHSILPRLWFWKTSVRCKSALMTQPLVFSEPWAVADLGWTHTGSQCRFLSAPKSQRFLRFAIAMPIADPRNRAISETRASNAALRFKGAMESR